MDLLNFDFSELFTWANILVILVGTFVGMFIGALPGLGIAIALVLLLPFTFNLAPLASILLLLSAFQAGEYGGSISAIILNIPGTAPAMATTFDGNPMARKSYPGKALAYSLTASTIGGLFGAAVLIFLSIPFSKLGLKISDPEYFLLAFLGLLGILAIESKSKIKTLISIVLGLMAGTVGMDMFNGTLRFTMGVPELMEGFGVIVIVVGFFAIPEVILLVSEQLHTRFITEKKGLSTKLTWKEFTSSFKPIGIGSTLGAVMGILPGLGSGVSSIFSYTIAKRFSKTPETFGTGNPEGIVAPESSNNASLGGSLIPLLTLGIPGTVGTAIVMSGFIIQGIQPGPNLFKGDPSLINGIFYGFILTTVAMYIIGRLVTPLFARSLTIPNKILIPTILILSIIGVYADKASYFDVWLMLAFGCIGFILRKLDYSIIGFILAFVLHPIIEESLRRTLILSDGSLGIFFTRGYSLAILILILFFVILTISSVLRFKKTSNT